MDEKDVSNLLNNILSSNNDKDVLLDIINKLENIINDSNNDIITERIKEVITTINKLIDDKNKRVELIRKDHNIQININIDNSINDSFNTNTNTNTNNNTYNNYHNSNNKTYNNNYYNNNTKDVKPIEDKTNYNKPTKTYDYGKYEGQFVNHNREGKGTFYYKNGDRYEGDWNVDKREGKGIYYYKDGRIL
jgi:hypothetical protein